MGITLRAAFQLVDQLLCCEPRDVCDRLAHGCQSRPCVPGQRGIVETRNRELARNVEPHFVGDIFGAPLAAEGRQPWIAYTIVIYRVFKGKVKLDEYSY